VQTLDDISSELLWSGYTYFSGQTQGIVRHFENFSDEVSHSYKFTKGMHVFDIGSNDGTLLKCFHDRGYEVYGVDPSDEVASVANSQGISTFVGLFSDEIIKNFPPEKQTADLITAFNVFAHSPNMQGMISGVKKMLKPDGIFCFEVQYLGDIVEKRLLGTIFHEHMIHYSLSSAKKFLEMNDMKLIDYSRNNIQMGSIIFHAAHKGSKRLTSEKIILFEKAEVDMGLTDGSWASGFVGYLEEQRARAKELRNKWGAYEVSVYGYGAARSGPTLLIQYGLEKTIRAVFDDHPSKSGKMGVFESLNVLPTSFIKDTNPQVIIILAWIHIEKIINNNIDFLKKGGTFVSLWPTVQEINIKNLDIWLADLKKYKS